MVMSSPRLFALRDAGSLRLLVDPTSSLVFYWLYQAEMPDLSKGRSVLHAPPGAASACSCERLNNKHGRRGRINPFEYFNIVVWTAAIAFFQGHCAIQPPIPHGGFDFLIPEKLPL
jgi:hypothetical protein